MSSHEVSDAVKTSFANASAGDVEDVVDGLSGGAKLDLARAIETAYRRGLSDDEFAVEIGCRTEVVTKLRSFMWPVVAD